MDSNKNMLFSSSQTRLHSFFTYPIENENSKAPSCMKLAEAGFERQPQSSSTPSDEVYCRMCGLKFSGWSGENPWVVHRTMRPKCLFLNTPSSAATQSVNSQGTALQTGRSNNTHVKGNKINNNKGALNNLRRQLFPMYDSLALKIEELPEIQHPFVPKRGNFLMLFESFRLLKFPDPCSPEAAIYAKAGFMYDVNSSCAVCVFCNVEVQFTPQEKIFLEIFHEEKSPSCPFIREYDVENISREDERLIHEKVRDQFFNSVNNEQDGGMSYLVKHPEFDQVSSRLGTFESWPALQADEFPANLMADCGFYYINFMDSVKCFSCGVGMRNWSKGADPFAQHAKASPHCWYILNKKGQEYVDVAQTVQLTIDVDYSEIEENSSESERAAVTPSSPLTPSSKSSSSCSSPSTSPAGTPHLDMEAIKAAMACQYTIEQIDDAVSNFFLFSCGKYPNEALLLGTLRVADVNHKVICDQQQEIIKTHSELSETKTQLKSKDSVIEATKSELARTQHTLQWQNLELRTELEQQFVGQIQQQSEALHHKDEVIHHQGAMLHHKDEVIHHKDAMLHQQGEVIQNNAIQLELTKRENEDLKRQLKSIQAALVRKEKEDRKDDAPVVNLPEKDHQANNANEDEFPVANCKVCLVNTSQIVFYPCKHLCCCDECAARLYGQNCPICREPNLTMEKVYVI